tara:strand:+ start:201 stop:605 length:405 start_codon:yes stop_codon:yes gene_type:complete
MVARGGFFGLSPICFSTPLVPPNKEAIMPDYIFNIPELTDEHKGFTAIWDTIEDAYKFEKALSESLRDSRYDYDPLKKTMQTLQQKLLLQKPKEELESMIYNRKKHQAPAPVSTQKTQVPIQTNFLNLGGEQNA